MEPCANQVGIRNIILTFYDCDNNVSYGPVSHELSGEDQPTYRNCDYTNESIPGGRVRKSKSSAMMTLNIIRDLGIPLAMYQGCASVDAILEHFNGLVVTGLKGNVTGDEQSDAHEVSMTLTFDELDELLPARRDSQAVAA